MTIRDNTAKQLQFGIVSEMNRRQIIWLCFYLILNRNFNLNISFDQNNYKEILSNEIRKLNLEDEINNAIAQAFISESYFEWLDKSGRQSEWILNNLFNQDYIQRFKSSNLFYEITPKERIIVLTDLSPITKQEKTHQVLSYQNNWVEQLMRDKAFDWFAGKDEKLKCEVAWDFLVTGDKLLIDTKPNKFQNKDDVLSFLDTFDLIPNAREYFLGEIKKKYKAEKVRLNREDKVQTNMSLSVNVRDQLDKLAERQGKTKTEIVEDLIIAAYKANNKGSQD